MPQHALPEKVAKCLEKALEHAEAFQKLQRPNDPGHGDVFDQNKTIAAKIIAFSYDWENLIGEARALRAAIELPPKSEEELGFGALKAKSQTQELSLSLANLVECAMDAGLPQPGQISTSWDESRETLEKIDARIARMEEALENIESKSGASVQIGPFAIPLEEATKRVAQARQALRNQANVNLSLLALALEQLSDFARETLSKWRARGDAASKALTKGFESIQKASSAGAATALRLMRKIRRGEKEQDNKPPSSAITPPDDETREQWELEAAIQIVMGQPIPAERRKFLRKLFIRGPDRALFEALKEAGADLSEIYFDPDVEPYERKLLFSDVTPLKGLTKLRRLYCDSTRVSDLAPLEDLTQMTILICDNTQVSNLSPLKDLTQLTSLSCNNTKVYDLKPLKELTKLRELFCDNTQVSDLTPLVELTQLRELSCYNTQVSDLTPLKELTQLTRLDCDNTQVSDLTPIKDLTNLTMLSCGDTKVSDWSPVDHIDNVIGRPDDWVREPR